MRNNHRNNAGLRVIGSSERGRRRTWSKLGTGKTNIERQTVDKGGKKWTQRTTKLTTKE